jgi:hypothetical protein
MSFNSDEIVQNIRTEFESMLQYVQGSDESTADAVERSLLKRLLGLGAHLMLLFFVLRASECSREPLPVEGGGELGYHSEKQRSYYSVFGKLPLKRAYFYARGQGGVSPLDEQLSLGADCYSDLVREMAEYLGVDVTYAKVSRLFARLLGQELSTQAIESMMATDAADVEGYYEQKPAPDVVSEAAILVVQADGKGVPMVRETPVSPKARLAKGDKRCKKKEAIVTSSYTIDPHPRTPESVIATFFAQEPTPVSSSATRSGPQNKQVWATLAGKDAAVTRLAGQVAKRDGDHIQHRVALTDGCEALQQRMQTYLPDFTLVLDFVHAAEYLWKAANALFGEKSPRRDPWVEQQARQILNGHTDQVIAHLASWLDKPRRSQAQRQALTSAATYFQRNRPCMEYHLYLARGWPIASGVIEGACRHLVKDRCELSGMRWTHVGAENLLRLRSVAENGDWDDYHQFRKQQRHLRLYGSPLSNPVDVEQQALQPVDSHKIIRLDRYAKRRPNHPNPEPQRLAA